MRFILEQGLNDFQKSFIDSTAVEANTERPTDSTILVRLIARVCTTGSNLHRWDLPDMNQIGLLEQLEELRRMSQQIHFLNGKARGEAKRKKVYFQLLRRVRRLRKRLLEGFGAESGRFRAEGDQTFRLLERWAFLANSSTPRYDKEKRKYNPTARRITSGSNSRHLNRPAIEGTSDIRPAYHLPTRKLQHFRLL